MLFRSVFLKGHEAKSESLIWFPYISRDFWNSMASPSTKVRTVKQRELLSAKKNSRVFGQLTEPGRANKELADVSND